MSDKVYKARKAKWVYECGPCRVEDIYPDRFRAVEHQQRHRREFTHGAALAIQSVQEFVDAFTRAFRSVRW